MNPTGQGVYVGVLLPLAVDKPYTYQVPEDLIPKVAFGLRVEVQFGKSRHYSGLIVETDLPPPATGKGKPLLNILDAEPLITAHQYRLWQWMARYYCCTLGEVMSASLPSHLKLSSETIILAGPRMEEALPELSDDAYLLAEALSIRNEITLEEVKQILDRKKVYPLLLDLLHQGIIVFQEALQERFKPKTVTAVRPGVKLSGDRSDTLRDLFTQLQRSPKQLKALIAFLELERQGRAVRKAELLAKAEVGDAVLKGLEEKGILETYTLVVSRLEGPALEDEASWSLSAGQQQALRSLREQFERTSTVLLQGITGSGKTLLYAELIKETHAAGQQVLYLLPEIALTTQLIHRLEKLTGLQVLTYHSRLNQHERVEIWRSVMTRPDIVLIGPRSGIFLPWFRLGLVIVDEEHDPSYKQGDPAPRYQGRDTAIMLAQAFEARVILGTATPSLETWHRASSGKYGHVMLTERFGGARLPEIRIVNMREESSKESLFPFSSVLIKQIRETMERKEQVLLFQNRRGYAPNLRCDVCGWTQECVHCDVSLTYHKPGHNMQCHYCGYHTPICSDCPKCGNRKLTMKGFGTQRIEDDLKAYFPDARMARMDMDTTRSRAGLIQLLDDFAERRIDILIGTQMITKGLDFDHLGLVGVLQADQLMAYPDFRATERAFQLLLQVAGRAGRKGGDSLVLIQTFEPSHPVIRDVLTGDLDNFYRRELEERRSSHYPPFCRILRLLVKHKQEEKVAWAADQMASQLRKMLGDKVQGPADPPIARIGGYHLRSIQLKLGLSATEGERVKGAILNWAAAIRNTRGMSGVIFVPDVDPM